MGCCISREARTVRLQIREKLLAENTFYTSAGIKQTKKPSWISGQSAFSEPPLSEKRETVDELWSAVT